MFGLLGSLLERHFNQLLQCTKANKEDAKRLVHRMENILHRLADAIPDATNVPEGLLKALKVFGWSAGPLECDVVFVRY